MRCPACGQENPEGFRFCGACGAELAPSRAAAREERKVVTVLFADLVGFISRAESMDPEDARALLSPYHERLRSELERFGGTVEKFIGDAVMALFGAPVAHEDDPERAVQAALSIAAGARVAFCDAGRRAFSLGAFAADVRFYRQALDLWPMDERARPSLLLELAESRFWSEEAGREEATAARDALVALGDRGKAAQAETILSAVASAERRGAEASAHLASARELAADLPASLAKATVLQASALLHVVLGESEAALAEAEELKRVAEAIGADEMLASAHMVTGQARITLGDADGIEDLERAVEIGKEIRSPLTPISLGNFAVMIFDLGLLNRALELIAEAHAYATRRGNRPMIAWLDVLRSRTEYWSGNWDDALRLTDEAIAIEQEGNSEVRPRTLRCQIRLARGRVEELQQLHTALATYARASLAAGDRASALQAFEELVERFVADGSQQLSASLPDFVAVAVDLDRTGAFLRAIAGLGKQTPWIEAARAYAEGDFGSAAATYGRIGSAPDAAYAYLRAAKALVEAGRGPEADAPLREALAFYRSVGAARYMREGEALLAAAS